MKRALEFMAVSWKTSLAGIITALASYIAMYPDEYREGYPHLVSFAKFIAVGGLASMGLFGKDADKGSNKPHEELPKTLQGPPDEPPVTVKIGG